MLLDPFVQICFDPEIFIVPANTCLPFKKPVWFKDLFIEAEITFPEEGDFEEEFKQIGGDVHLFL